MSAWIPLIATGLGGLIAISSAALSDFLKNRRDERNAQRQSKEQLSIQFILAANRATGLLRRVTSRGLDLAALPVAAREAVGDSGLYDARELVLLSAPKNLAAAAEKAFHPVLAIRDAVITGGQPDSPAYRQAYRNCIQAIWDIWQAAPS
jgi:hypothetical protein